MDFKGFRSSGIEVIDHHVYPLADDVLQCTGLGCAIVQDSSGVYNCAPETCGHHLRINAASGLKPVKLNFLWNFKPNQVFPGNIPAKYLSVDLTVIGCGIPGSRHALLTNRFLLPYSMSYSVNTSSLYL
ncbi:hypothetical protein HN51_012854 [Arachis hypogaea]